MTIFKHLNTVTVCTALPESWDKVKTKTEFPVDTGTTITVSCQEGYINTGSKVVTCNTELHQDFEYETLPTCNKTSKREFIDCFTSASSIEIK